MSSLDLNKENENLTEVPVTEVIDTTSTPEITEVSVAEVAEPAAIIIKTDYSNHSRQQLVDALKLLVDGEIEQIKEDVESIKQLFYKKQKSELEELKKLFVENGGEETEFKAQIDDLESTLKSLLNDYKARKSALIAKLEQEKEQNLLQKQHILEQMKNLVESNDDVSSHITEFKNLQQKWKSIGNVPATVATTLWKQYNIYQEKFWDLIKINNEFREYDFKKNLEAKTLICEAAERLAEVEDVISAFQQLQKFHAEWHELGPVSREHRDEIWNRFKEASSVINKKHQGHFDSIRQIEEENQAVKTALCEKIEAFDYKTLNTYKAWDDATQAILAWQEEWRTLGFAPRKTNQQLFERYRSVCDAFFAAKNEFYKESKNVLNQNLDKKKALCEQAEALKDSTDWKDTTDKLIQLQKEWKMAGPIAKKISDELWKRFITACDYFFELKNKSVSSTKSVEGDNLLKKKELIQKIQSLKNEGNAAETLTTLRAFMAEWNTIGHVPFKEKDKVYKEYREAVDMRFEVLNVDASQRRLDNFKNNLKDISSKGENKLYREREKLVRAYEHLKSEIATYENNIGFFSSASKKGGGLIKEMERKIEALKDESKLIEEKIKLIDQSI
jgi:DNA repair exonuclease SbcCD ATPase subunit